MKKLWAKLHISIVFEMVAQIILLITIPLFWIKDYSNFEFVCQFIFYGIMWNLGYIRKKKIISNKGYLIGALWLIVMVALSSYAQGLLIYDVQNTKFPPSLKYLFVSLLIILIAEFFEFIINLEINLSKIFIYVGRISIFYFFAQGIGSSVIFYLRDSIVIETKYWLVKWLLLLMVNIIITSVIAEVFALINKTVHKIINNIKEINIHSNMFL